MRRVVFTGMGLVTPLGSGVEAVWERLLAGQSGIRAIQNFDVSDLAAKIAGQVRQGETADFHDVGHRCIGVGDLKPHEGQSGRKE